MEYFPFSFRFLPSLLTQSTECDCRLANGADGEAAQPPLEGPTHRDPPTGNIDLEMLPPFQSPHVKVSQVKIMCNDAWRTKTTKLSPVHINPLLKLSRMDIEILKVRAGADPSRPSSSTGFLVFELIPVLLNPV